MNEGRRGYVALIVLLIIVVLAVIAGIWYYEAGHSNSVTNLPVQTPPCCKNDVGVVTSSTGATSTINISASTSQAGVPLPEGAAAEAIVQSDDRATTTVGWLTYQNDCYGISLKYPPSLTVSAQQYTNPSSGLVVLGDFLISFSADGSVYYPFDGNLPSVFIQPAPTGTIDEWAMQNLPPTFSTTSNPFVEPPAISIVYPPQEIDDEASGAADITLTVHNGHLIDVGDWGQENQYPWMATFDKNITFYSPTSCENG
jgi:hypothetical protein